MDGQGTKCHRNIAENFNRLSRAHERYRQTDGPAIAYSERELTRSLKIEGNRITLFHLKKMFVKAVSL